MASTRAIVAGTATFSGASGTITILTGAGYLVGWSAMGTGASGVDNITIYDNTAASGQAIGVFRLTTSLYNNPIAWLYPGIRVSNGITVDCVQSAATTTVTVVVYYATSEVVS